MCEQKLKEDILGLYIEAAKSFRQSAGNINILSKNGDPITRTDINAIEDAAQILTLASETAYFAGIINEEKRDRILSSTNEVSKAAAGLTIT